MTCACTSGTPARLSPCADGVTSYSPNICDYTDFGMDAGDQSNIPFSTLYEPTSGKRNDSWDKDLKTSNIRFFNEPIEQIPGYRWGEFQILIHGCKNGLRWWSPVCVEPVMCVCTGEQMIKQKMYVIADAPHGDPVEFSNCDTAP